MRHAINSLTILTPQKHENIFNATSKLFVLARRFIVVSRVIEQRTKYVHLVYKSCNDVKFCVPTSKILLWNYYDCKSLTSLFKLLYIEWLPTLCFRATITIKCEMDFVLYPLDVQNCAIDFSSCKYQDYVISKWYTKNVDGTCFWQNLFGENILNSNFITIVEGELKTVVILRLFKHV